MLETPRCLHSLGCCRLTACRVCLRDTTSNRRRLRDAGGCIKPYPAICHHRATSPTVCTQWARIRLCPSCLSPLTFRLTCSLHGPPTTLTRSRMPWPRLLVSTPHSCPSNKSQTTRTWRASRCPCCCRTCTHRARQHQAHPQMPSARRLPTLITCSSRREATLRLATMRRSRSSLLCFPMACPSRTRTTSARPLRLRVGA